jgi:hypothetical protein
MLGSGGITFGGGGTGQPGGFDIGGFQGGAPGGGTTVPPPQDWLPTRLLPSVCRAASVRVMHAPEGTSAADALAPGAGDAFN